MSDDTNLRAWQLGREEAGLPVPSDLESILSEMSKYGLCHLFQFDDGRWKFIINIKGFGSGKLEIKSQREHMTARDAAQECFEQMCESIAEMKRQIEAMEAPKA